MYFRKGINIFLSRYKSANRPPGCGFNAGFCFSWINAPFAAENYQPEVNFIRQTAGKFLKNRFRKR
jgi:hypothetical protein